jgi:hypothetical protein
MAIGVPQDAPRQQTTFVSPFALRRGGLNQVRGDIRSSSTASLWGTKALALFSLTRGAKVPGVVP